MHLTTKTIITAALTGLMTLVAASSKADSTTTNTITVAFTASVQGNTNDDGTITTVAAPSKHSVATANLLSWLALAENGEGNFPSNSFPSGAKLVVFQQDFMVLDKNNNLLVDVSDIISATDSKFGVSVVSGKQNDTTGLAATSETELHLLTIHYDDTGIPGSNNVKFYLMGMMTSTTTDTAPNSSTQIYTETQSHKLASGIGEGFYQGQPFTITGTLSAIGKGNFVFVP
jgi:hypothetical protein